MKIDEQNNSKIIFKRAKNCHFSNKRIGVNVSAINKKRTRYDVKVVVQLDLGTDSYKKGDLTINSMRLSADSYYVLANAKEGKYTKLNLAWDE